MTQPKKILEEGRNCYRLASCRRVAFLIDGEAYFKALAEVLEKACQAVYILGWDFDSRIHLIRGHDHPHPGPELGAFLSSLAEKSPGLHFHILDWDFPMIYALEREPLPIFRIGIQSHRRVHFEMDSNHPLGASQHQKLVVVDDQIAFVGGLDLTACRWDTQEHGPDEPRRIDNSKKYHPFHDVQMMVEGDAAKALGELARERWKKATGKTLSAPSSPSDPPWPSSLEPDLEDTEVGIARTQPTHDGQDGVLEIEKLYEDAIQAARNLIYIENQYFTAHKVGEALVARLKEENGPEVILVLPRQCSGWLEEGTMGVLRARLLSQLERYDRWNRLRIYYPCRRDFGDEYINVHAKVMVTDDSLLRIGSANLNNRSMGLDSECDLVLEAGANETTRKEISRFRNRLLAEHCGTSVTEVHEALAIHDSTAAAIESLSANTRYLAPFKPEVDELVDGIIPDSKLIDPERPIRMEKFINQFSPGIWEKDEKGKPRNIPISFNAVKIVGIILLIFGFYAAWRWTPLGEWFNAETLAAWGKVIREAPLAPMIVLSAYIIAGLVLFPVTILIIATTLAFGPVPGFLYALSGSLSSAIATYFVGRLLGRRTIRNLIGKRLNRLSHRLARKGLLTILTVRIIPVAPFTVVNMVAGASHIKLRDYFWGTVLGMVPGILALTAVGKGLGEFLFTEEPKNLIPAILFFAAAATSLLVLRHLLKQKEGKDQPEKGVNDG